MKLDRAKALYLIKRIKKKIEASYPDISKKTYQYYGFGSKFDPTKPSLKGYMEEQEEVQNYLNDINKNLVKGNTGYFELNGKRFYQLELDVKKLRELTFEIDENYATIFLITGGFSNEEKFLEYYTAEHPSTIYDGYYWSFRENSIKEFTLTIDFSSKPYQAIEQGLHDDTSMPKYIGVASIDGQHLYIDLQRENGADRLKLVAHTGKVHPKERTITPCVFMGISVHANNIIHAEAVLIRKEDNIETKEMTLDRTQSLRKYLYLKRDNQSLKYYGYGRLQELTVKGSPVNRIRHMIGTHRVWSMNNKGDIIQSKFVIEENYRSYMYSDLYNTNEEKQVCLLNISQAINRRLCISTHPKQGVGIISYNILDIPPKEYTYIHGVYCHVGLENRHSRAGYFIMVKDNPSSFKHETIPRKDFDAFADGDQKLIDMRLKLYEWNSMSFDDD